MCTALTCVPRILTAEQEVESVKNAIKINPLNGINTEGLKAASFRPTAIDNRDVSAIARLAVLSTKYWGRGGLRLTVGFLDAPSGELRDKILSHLNAWSGDQTDIEFVYTADATNAQVRINRERHDDPEWNGYWSFLGTDVLKFEGPYGQTMNLQGFTMATEDSEFFRVVRHEAGHTLGFPHEHMRPELVGLIDRDKAIAYFEENYGWEASTTINQVLTPLNETQLISTPFADPNSIMAYRLPKEILVSGASIPGGDDINQNDRDFASLVY